MTLVYLCSSVPIRNLTGKLKKLFAEIEHGNQALGPSRVRHSPSCVTPNAFLRRSVALREASVLERLREDFEGDCNCSDEGGTTPLLRAAALGQREIVQVLMEHKARRCTEIADGGDRQGLSGQVVGSPG